MKLQFLGKTGDHRIVPLPNGRKLKLADGLLRKQDGSVFFTPDDLVSLDQELPGSGYRLPKISELRAICSYFESVYSNGGLLSGDILNEKLGLECYHHKLLVCGAIRNVCCDDICTYLWADPANGLYGVRISPESFGVFKESPQKTDVAPVDEWDDGLTPPAYYFGYSVLLVSDET